MIARIAMAMLLAAFAAAAAPCDPCALPAGSYRAAAPPGWDGHAPLPLLLFLHGWRATGENMIDDPAIAGPAARQGFLLIAPDGLGRSWAHVGAPPGPRRDDLAFLHDVVADVELRWPIDPRAVVAAGFSVGASMVWDLACYAPQGFTAFLSFSGGFWQPMPQACTAGPVDLRHVHGRDDDVVPLGGRAFSATIAQADIRAGFARWLAEDRCPAPARIFQGSLDCESWSGCAGGHRLQFCLRAGGHFVDSATLENGLVWALARP